MKGILRGAYCVALSISIFLCGVNIGAILQRYYTVQKGITAKWNDSCNYTIYGGLYSNVMCLWEGQAADNET